MSQIVKRISRTALVVVVAAVSYRALHAQQSTPRRQPGADITLYAPEQHDLVQHEPLFHRRQLSSKSLPAARSNRGDSAEIRF